VFPVQGFHPTPTLQPHLGLACLHHFIDHLWELFIIQRHIPDLLSGYSLAVFSLYNRFFHPVDPLRIQVISPGGYEDLSRLLAGQTAFCVAYRHPVGHLIKPDPQPHLFCCHQYSMQIPIPDHLGESIDNIDLKPQFIGQIQEEFFPIDHLYKGLFRSALVCP